MTKIFRYTNIALLLTAFITVGAMTGFAQDNCGDAEGQLALSDKFRAEFPKTDVAGRKAAITTGKEFLEKYGSCESAADMVGYLKTALPTMEKNLKTMEDAQAKQALYNRFDAAVKSKNWDDVYASGREILAKEPDQLDLMITLGSIGYDELFEGRTNFKYNDDTIRYARQAIAAIESGKTAKTYGLFGWSFKDKQTALAELNLTIGYLTQVAQKNKKEAVPFLYKVTQSGTAASKNPIPYELIGQYYFDELNALVTKIKAAEATQSPNDTPEVAQQKVDDIKALVALANGTAERAMDAFSRAFSNADPKAVDYKKQMKSNVETAYRVRFGKTEGVDSWIAGVNTKPFPNPTTPVTPIKDPEPVNTATTSSTAVAAPAAATEQKVAPATAKPASTKTVAKKKTR
jgi:tetratricopeptide (TPR) repeat protein